MSSSTIRRILATTDLSPGRDDVMVQAGLLASHAGAELHLLHSVAPLDPDAIGERARQTLRERQEELVERARRDLPPGLPAVHAEVAGGTPDYAVLQYAARAQPDMIVVGPHRGSKLDARVLGTTAERILRAAEVPCLVVRGALPLPLRRIGVAHDLSDAAQHALRLSVAWADALLDRGAPGAGVRVLHVGNPVDAASAPDYESGEVRPALSRGIEDALRAASATTPVPVEAELVWAHQPGEAILSWCERERVDLLVTGTSGTGGLKRALLGSVATELAQGAPCPVLVVPAKQRGD